MGIFLEVIDLAKYLILFGSPGRIRTSDQPVNSRFGVAPACALGYNLSKLVCGFAGTRIRCQNPYAVAAMPASLFAILCATAQSVLGSSENIYGAIDAKNGPCAARSVAGCTGPVDGA
jgi:hypothetical protein